MPLPPSTQDIDLFEPADADFFDRHKNSIFGGIAAVLLIIIAAGTFQVIRHNRYTAEATAFAEATSIEKLQTIANAKDGLFAANARLLLSEKYRTEGKFEEALSILDNFEKKFPKHPLIFQAALSKAATLEAQGKLEEAAEAFNTVYTKYPDTAVAPFAMLSRGRLLRLLGKNEEAKNVLQSAVTRYPNATSSQEALQELDQLPSDKTAVVPPSNTPAASSEESTPAAP